MATYVGFSQSNNLVTNADDAFLGLSINTRSKSFAFDGDEAKILTELVITTGVSTTNIDFDEVTRSGIKWDTYSDIFYNRIWIIPSSIDLTGAPSNFTTTVSVWNSYFVQKTMTAVTPNNITGINFSPTVPHTFRALEIQSYNLALTNSVPATVNGNYQFTFSDAEDPYLLISGVLSVAFPFLHNWDDNPVIERISYLTNVIEAKSGKEQRVRLRKYPRRQIEFKTLIADSNDYNRNAIQRQVFHNQMMFGRSKTWLAPMCHDYDFLTYDLASGSSVINTPTLYRDYTDNGYVLLYKSFDYYEVVRIDALSSGSFTILSPTTKDFSSGTRVCPLRQAVFSGDTSSGEIIVYEAETHDLVWDILVQEYGQERITPYSPVYTYRGYDVYLQTSDFDSGNTMEIYSPQRRLDNNTGIFGIDSRFALTKERTTLNLTLRNKQKISEFFGFLDYRAGKLVPMWVPTFSEDVQIAQAGGSGDTTIKIKNIGYSLYIKQANVRKDLMFIKTDGSPVFRRILGSQDNGDGTETITIDSPLGFDFTSTSFNYISFLRFSRLDDDTAELSYITTDIAQTNLKIVDLFEVP